MTEPRKLRIFISYTESDQAWAEWVADKVSEAGHEPIMQHRDSPPGENFVLWVNDQLNHSDIVMPLYSEAYFKSNWCTTEWTNAMSANKYIIPIKIRPCELPAVLTSITYLDVTGRSEKSIGRLLNTGLGTPEKAARRRDQVGYESPEARSQRIVKAWKRAALAAVALGFIGTAVFAPKSTTDSDSDNTSTDGTDTTGDGDITTGLFS